MRLLLLLLLLAAPALAQPVFDAGGPDAAAYGAAEGYRLPARVAMAPQEFMVGLYSHYDQVTARIRTVPHGPAPSPLRRAAASPNPVIDAYLERTPATGLLVAQGDTILHERYRYGRSDQDRFLSQSMAKTVTGLLVGIAVQEGRIHSIDDTAATYAPELQGSEYGATPIRALLHMASGVQFLETYKPGDDNERLGRALSLSDAPGFAVRQFNTRIAAPGARFSYAGAETEVLGLVVARATGTTLSDYLSTRLWIPMGMEADAAWAIDRTGQEIAYCCLVARLRDWARLGLMLANDGAWNGRQIIPRQWLLDATTAAPDAPWALGRISGGRGYGYQLWLIRGGERNFGLFGIHGQRMLIEPASKLVLVQTAVFVPAGGPEMSGIFPLWAALRAQYAR